jgi:hypothetical protein
MRPHVWSRKGKKAVHSSISDASSSKSDATTASSAQDSFITARSHQVLAPFVHVPEDVFSLIAAKLDAFSLVNLSHTCQAFNKHLSTESGANYVHYQALPPSLLMVEQEFQISVVVQAALNEAKLVSVRTSSG